MPKMIRTVSIRLKGHFEELRQTVDAFLGACNEVSWQAVFGQEFNAQRLQREFYRDLREEWGLKAQMACTVFRTVAARYKHSDAKERRRRRERGIFFQRCSMPLQYGRDWSLRKAPHHENSKEKVLFSISTLQGRVAVEGQIGSFQRRYLDAGWEASGAVLVCKGSEVWLHITMKKEAPPLATPTEGSTPQLVGVDVGQNNLAVFDFQRQQTAFWKGGKIKDRQRKFRRVFQSLQSKGTRAARRTLRRLGGKQRRWQRQQNHCVANAIVKRTMDCGAHGIALENLVGIRKKGKRRTAKQRADFHGWAFGELRQILAYKAAAQGLSVIFVNPYQTSQMCPCCHHAAPSQRQKHLFRCQACRYELNADLVGARNIAQRACA